MVAWPTCRDDLAETPHNNNFYNFQINPYTRTRKETTMNLKKATKLYKELTEYALKKDELCSIPPL